jgi:hypothetical protein
MCVFCVIMEEKLTTVMYEHVCVYVMYMYVYIHIYMAVCLYMRIAVVMGEKLSQLKCIDTQVCICMGLIVYVWVHESMDMNIYKYILGLISRLYMYVYTYIHTYVCIYIHGQLDYAVCLDFICTRLHIPTCKHNTYTQGQLDCAVCLDSITDPAMTRCEHVFCSECLQGCIREAADSDDSGDVRTYI